MRMKRIALLLGWLPIGIAVGVGLAVAQSSPNWPTGYNPTTAEINAAFAQKLDSTGGTFTNLKVTYTPAGTLLLAVSASGQPLNGVDFSAVTFTGSAFKSTGFSVDGSGNTVVNNVTANNLTASGAVSMSPANANVVISPTGTGSVTISPAGATSLTMKPANAGTMDNMAIGQTTPLAGAFTSATIGGATVYAGHSLIGIQTFCASGCTHTTGTYTADTGTNQVIFEVVAAGGGSGGCGGTTASQTCVGGSGASGSYAKVLYTSAFSGITLTVGAAGTAGTAVPAAGGVGGTTSVGSLISCPGGTGGPVGVTANIAAWSPLVGAAAAPAACTISGGTTIASVAGQGSGYGFAQVNSSGSQFPGSSGGTPLGTGTPFALGNVAATFVGSPGSGYGWGAGGAINALSQSATVGLAGGPSRIIAYEYN